MVYTVVTQITFVLTSDSRLLCWSVLLLPPPRRNINNVIEILIAASLPFTEAVFWM